MMQTAKPVDKYKSLKQGIWLYFWLLMFEGAIRRYVPPLANPFLIVRDPIALWLIYTAWKKGLLPQNIYILLFPLIAIISIITTLLFGHGNFFVAVYGARPFLVHFPLLFVIGSVFDRDDVIKIGKSTLWLSIPMVVLVAVQFYSPQSAWINRSVGDSGESGRLTGALGFYRPPGTFSFTSGLTLYCSFITPFVLYFLLQPVAKASKLMIIGSTLALIASIPLSLSRTVLFQVGVTIGFVALALGRKPKMAGKLIGTAVVLSLVFLTLSNTEFFQKATQAFSARLDNAEGSEGGVGNTFSGRFLGGLAQAFENADDLPFFGWGIGMGTNAGAQLLTGQRAFLIAEGEWGRVMGEMGMVLGFLIIFLRCLLLYSIGIASYRKLSAGDLLPWMLLSFGVLHLSQGGWSQPTSLGFYVIIGGLLLASLKQPRKDFSLVNNIKSNTI